MNVNELFALVKEKTYKPALSTIEKPGGFKYNKTMKIYVMTHKKIDPPSESIYVPLHVGRALGTDLGYLGDDTGENISDLNPYFGELTGLYWIWQNDRDSDYIGIAHYRRFYLNDDNEIMNEDDFMQILSKYDCMTSDQNSTGETNHAAYGKTHPIKDLDEVGRSLKKLYPEYSDSYDRYMEDTKSCYSNLAVMPREMFLDYCGWLFTILFDASENINVEGYDLYQQRVYGFLSEMLLDVYVRHHNYNVYRCPVGTFGDKAETNELIAAVGHLISNGQIKEARNLCLSILDARPDITLPMSDSKHRVPIVEHITCILDLEDDAGLSGFTSVSTNINELIDHYRKLHEILENKGTPDGVSYLRSNNFSPFAALVMISNDIARGIRRNPINRETAESILKEALSKEDFEKYLKFMETVN